MSAPTSAPLSGRGAAVPAAAAIPPRRGLLALSLQEVFTAIARLRSGRQAAADAQSFRTRIQQVLHGAEQEARTLGYTEDDVRIALFAATVLVDESVLTSGQEMFAGWSGRPLQEELFGEHMGGELFFRYLQPALTRQDSEETADLLEVFQLCLLLGFRGRYGTASAELGQLMGQIGDKVARIRGGGGELSPAWHPTVDLIRSRPDRWVRRLAVIAVLCVLAAGLTFAFSSISLRSGQSDLAAISTPAAR